MASPYKTTVTDPAEDRDLVALETVKRDLGISTATDDAWLSDQISAASAMCETFTNRRLVLEAVRDDFRFPFGCSGIDLLTLSRYPVAVISAIVEAGETLAEADYEFEAETGFLWRLDGDDNRRLWFRDKISVTYEGGYAVEGDVEGAVPLPLEIAQACISIVKRNWFARVRDPLVKRTEIPDVMTQEFWVGQIGAEAALTPEAAALLAPHRRILL